MDSEDEPTKDIPFTKNIQELLESTHEDDDAKPGREASMLEKKANIERNHIKAAAHLERPVFH